jgi:hypothetical protein
LFGSTFEKTLLTPTDTAAKTWGGGSQVLVNEAQALSFTERVVQLLEHVRYRRAQSEADLEAIFRLRYDAMGREASVASFALGRLEDRFDRNGNAYNFGVFIHGQLASALRVHALNHVDQLSPASTTFAEYLAPALIARSMIITPDWLVANDRLARRYPELPYVTLRAAVLAAEHLNARLLALPVPIEHQAFYRKVLFARVVCPPRPCPPHVKPLGLLLVDFTRERKRILERHAFWASSNCEREALLDR